MLVAPAVFVLLSTYLPALKVTLVEVEIDRPFNMMATRLRAFRDR